MQKAETDAEGRRPSWRERVIRALQLVIFQNQQGGLICSWYLAVALVSSLSDQDQESQRSSIANAGLYCEMQSAATASEPPARNLSGVRKDIIHLIAELQMLDRRCKQERWPTRDFLASAHQPPTLDKHLGSSLRKLDSDRHTVDRHNAGATSFDGARSRSRLIFVFVSDNPEPPPCTQDHRGCFRLSSICKIPGSGWLPSSHLSASDLL